MTVDDNHDWDNTDDDNNHADDDVCEMMRIQQQQQLLWNLYRSEHSVQSSTYMYCVIGGQASPRPPIVPGGGDVELSFTFLSLRASSV
ncbi:hypothetical protein PoB_001607000 [Plakobranchus ocellatus]|uniref:Uncharacterized protein n=1 Tax=Plakobranchus ocellatus TaxID=259542 RepID=A0AAV3Z315_9GAST|nr:hypothetical protein PoB_001607000 [Plakobranchus ocellatus]